MVGLALCMIFGIAVWSLHTSLQNFIAHMQARRAAVIVFPPLRTVETSDEVPF